MAVVLVAIMYARNLRPVEMYAMGVFLRILICVYARFEENYETPKRFSRRAHFLLNVIIHVSVIVI